jgi:hypothetical protein
VLNSIADINVNKIDELLRETTSCSQEESQFFEVA